jgi:predicted ABC-type ATPase
MTSLVQAVDEVRREQRRSRKPLAVILAGHNGSGKSTMWLRHLSPNFQIPLGRVTTRVAEGGHNVDVDKLIERFPRTQRAIGVAASVANATTDRSVDRWPGSCSSNPR